MVHKVGNKAVIDTVAQHRTSRFAAWSPKPIQFYSAWDLSSIGHKHWRTGQGDNGGPFKLFKTTYDINPSTFNTNVYVGPAVGTNVLQQDVGLGSGLKVPTDSEMETQGATAVARSLPTNPSFSLAQTLGEAREGMPRAIGASLLKDDIRVAREAGGEYLNYQFGWLPLVSDLRNLAHSVKHHNQVIDGYRKGSSKKIKKRYVFDPQTTIQQFSGQVILDGQANIQGPGLQTDDLTSSAWFEGAFRYYVPVPDTQWEQLLDYERQANILLGTRPDPELFWNLAPWSWAADWYSNAGDVIHNISQFGRDGLVMQYGYMMKSNIFKRTVIYNGTFQGAGFSGSFIKEVKSLNRVGANPYGFGLTGAATSNRQLAIIAALGMSRAG